MKDRIPTYPGRVKLTQVSGNIYDMERADQPSEAGTPLNKATFLKDATAALFGLTSAAVPDDVLAAIATGRAKIETGSYTGTGTYGSAHPSSIAFSITPKLVLIKGMLTPSILGGSFFTGTMQQNYSQVVSWSGNTMSWYSNGGNAGYQLNTSGQTYEYCAIGV